MIALFHLNYWCNSQEEKQELNDLFKENELKEILKVIGRYSKALNLLDDYDHRTLKKIKGNSDDRKIEYTECLDIIKHSI